MDSVCIHLYPFVIVGKVGQTFQAKQYATQPQVKMTGDRRAPMQKNMFWVPLCCNTMHFLVSYHIRNDCPVEINYRHSFTIELRREAIMTILVWKRPAYVSQACQVTAEIEKFQQQQIQQMPKLTLQKSKLTEVTKVRQPDFQCGNIDLRQANFLTATYHLLPAIYIICFNVRRGMKTPARPGSKMFLLLFAFECLLN